MEKQKIFEMLFIKTWIRVMKRLENKNRQTNSFNQLQKNMKPILEKHLGPVIKVQDWIQNLSQEVSKANYDQDYLTKIYNQNEPFLEILTNSTDPPDFNEEFYNICGDAIQELAPILYQKIDQDSKRVLIKVCSPLTGLLFRQSNLKSNSLKIYSKLVPKLMIGFVSAVTNFQEDGYLLSKFREVVINAIGKLPSAELEPTLRMVFGSFNVKFVQFQTIIQKLFLQVSKYSKASMEKKIIKQLILQGGYFMTNQRNLRIVACKWCL